MDGKKILLLNIFGFYEAPKTLVLKGCVGIVLKSCYLPNGSDFKWLLQVIVDNEIITLLCSTNFSNISFLSFDFEYYESFLNEKEK